MSKPIYQLNMLSPEERHKVIVEFNRTAVEYRSNQCVHTQFEEQAEKQPNKTAVIACDKTFTYGQLNKEANRIAHSLIAKGVRPGDIVAFMLPRRSYLLSVMFGILKSGAAYLPVDPDYPQDRIDYMLSDSGAKFCITEKDLTDLNNKNIQNPGILLDTDALCYCIYTSGSTGQPKGTGIRHKNLINFCNISQPNNLQGAVVEGCSSALSVGSVTFDIFLFESMLPLLNGLAVVLADEKQIADADQLAKLINQNRIDYLNCTPSKMEIYLQNVEFAIALKNLQVIMLGGEVLPNSLVCQIRKHSNARIFNGYGPTETTLGVSFGEVQEKE